MITRFRTALGLVLLLGLIASLHLYAAPALAGGWAVITLDELPTKVIAGKPVTIGFTVLQHGRTPMEGLAPTVTATLLKEEPFVVHAEPEGRPGHYTATLTFPKQGAWSWSIQAFTMDQPMPALQVVEPAPETAVQPAVNTEPFLASMSPLFIVRLLALGIGLAGLALAFRRRRRLPAALISLSLLLGLGTFITGAATPGVEAQTRGGSASETLSNSSISQVELGQQLFVAKGCITCHHNNKVERASAYWTIETGAPNLTKFSASPEALRLRLKDPLSVKSDTMMPNLNLSDAEIEALIAFINSK